jgi:TatD DNase family protein
MIEIFREFRPRLAANPGIIHFFSGNEKEAGEFLGMNFCFSFGGIVTFAERYAELVGFIPLEKILLETDAPYVAPVPLRGKRNEPAYLVHVARKIAELKKVAVEEVAETTTATARRLFRL